MPHQQSSEPSILEKRDYDNRAYYYKGASFFAIIFCFFAIMQVSNWPLLKYWGVKGHIDFVDLNSVLGSADCFRSIGFEIYEYPIGHECAYNYGSWLMLSINALGLRESHTEILGWSFILGVSMVLAFVIAKAKLNTITIIFAFLIFLSPPVMLLLERGNFDILIILLMVLSARLMMLQKVNLSIAVAFVSFLYKFYTAGLVLVATFFSRSIFVFVFWVAFFVAGLFQVGFDFRRGPGFINTEQNSFGGPVFGIYLKYLGIEIPYIASLFLGLCILLIVLCLFNLKQSRISANMKSLKHENLDIMKSKFVFLAMIVVHTTCYVLGMNFDYRLIMLAIANFILVTQSTMAHKSRLFLGVLTVLIMWTSFNFKYLQPIGDLLIGVMTVHYVAIIWWFLLSTDRGKSMYQSLLRLSRRFV